MIEINFMYGLSPIQPWRCIENQAVPIFFIVLLDNR